MSRHSDWAFPIGLNRGHNNITNTIAAAQVAKKSMPNLLALELGNEPECPYPSPILLPNSNQLSKPPTDSNPQTDWLSANQPAATSTGTGTWTAADDARSQDNWDILVGSALNTPSIIQAGTSLMNPPGWGAAELIATENNTAQGFVKSYSHHNYPGGTVQSLMAHSNVVSNVAGCKYLFPNLVSAAERSSERHIWGPRLITMIPKSTPTARQPHQ